jgi:hypothetical protein
MKHAYILLPLGLAACSGFHLESGQQVNVEPEVEVVVDFEPCAEVSSAAVSDGASDRDLALGLACLQPSRVSLSSVTQAFTDGDSLASVAWLIRCADDEACGSPRGAELGFAGFLATRISTATASVELPEALQIALDERYAAAIETVQERVDELNVPRQSIYVDLPRTVYREFQAGRDRFAENYQLFETMAPIAHAELEEGTASNATYMELTSIRDTTVADCLASSGLLLQECLDGPITRATTDLLLRYAVASEDWPRARVELQYLESGSDRSSFVSALIARQLEASEIAQQRFNDAQEASARGASAEEISQQFGDVANVSDDQPLPWSPPGLPVSRSQIDETVEQACGVLESRSLDGDRVRLEFSRVRISPREFSCEVGDRQQVRWANRVIVMPDCDDFDETIRLRPEPIHVSRADAQNLEEGNLVEAWVDSARLAAVSSIFSDDDSTVPTHIGAFENP